MIPSWVGTIIVTTSRVSSALRPRNRSLAKANPARVEKNTTETVIDPDTTNEFTSASANGAVSNACSATCGRDPS